MQLTPYHFLPFPLFVYLAFVALYIIVIALIEIGIVHYAAEQLGMERRRVFLLLMLCLIGSYINIPIAHLPPEKVESGKIVTIFGVPYVVPVVHEWPSTVLAVNIGGAVIPTGLACYLILKNRLYYQSIIGIIAVSLIAYAFSHPVHGVGISIPILIPPMAAVLVATLFSPKRAAPLAYISGTLGTLIGADLCNLGAVAGAWRTGGLDWRRGDFRWNFSHGNTGCPVGIKAADVSSSMLYAFLFGSHIFSIALAMLPRWRLDPILENHIPKRGRAMATHRGAIALSSNGVFFLPPYIESSDHLRKRCHEGGCGLRGPGRSRGRRGSCSLRSFNRSRAAGSAAGGAFRAKVLHHALVLRTFALVLLLHQSLLHPGVAALRRADKRIGALLPALAALAVVAAIFPLAAAAAGKQRAEFLALDFPAIFLDFFRAANQLARAFHARAFASALGASVWRAAIGRSAGRHAARILGGRLGRNQGQRERQANSGHFHVYSLLHTFRRSRASAKRVLII